MRVGDAFKQLKEELEEEEEEEEEEGAAAGRGIALSSCVKFDD